MKYTSSRLGSLKYATLALVCISVWVCVCATAVAETRVEIPAWSFDRGTCRVVENPDPYSDYRDIFPDLVVVGDEKKPWQVEYDFDFPADATYDIEIRYGSPQQRPIELWLDDKKIATCCGRITGDAPPYLDRHPKHGRLRPAEGFHGVEWDAVCSTAITKGKHTLKLKCDGTPPRISALSLIFSAETPGDWKLAAPSVVRATTGHAACPRYGPRMHYDIAFDPPNPEMDIQRIPPLYRTAFIPPGDVNIATLRMAIEDVTAEFGPRYAKGPEYLGQLTELEAKQKAIADGTAEEKKVIEDALRELRHAAMTDHPLLKIEKLLFVKRMNNSRGRIYRWFRCASGGNLCILSAAEAGKSLAKGNTVTNIAPQLDEGIFGRFDLSYDAKTIVFSYKKPGDHFRIYEIGIDGKGLRQLTFDAPEGPAEIGGCLEGCGGRNYDDLDPCYLPSGKIVFVSNRRHRVVFCAGDSVTTLHLMDADGKNLRCLSEGPISELDPAVMNDGRIIHMRWEYVDKGFGNVQSLWSMHPDGSYSDHFYKNNVVLPGGMVDPRSIPGSTKIVTIAAPHSGLSIGPVMIVDTRTTRRTGRAMKNITPEIALPGMMHQALGTEYGYFKEPYPLSEKLFLVSHNPNKPQSEAAGHALYVLDAWGNRTEIYRDPEISCFQPIPLRPRRKPTQIPSLPGIARQREAIEKLAQSGLPKQQELGTLFMQDVYRGLTGIERGRIKYLRVMEARALHQSEGGSVRINLQVAAVSLGGDVHLKKVHGIVPVHEDGSAYFAAPAQTNLYFQALDENYMEVQRMRSFINLMPGESRSCIGCHEHRRNAPPARGSHPLALNEPPARIMPQPGDTGPHMVHYASDIQPILDKHCVGCHSGEEPKGDLNLSGDTTWLWSVSYEELINKELVSFLHGCFGEANIPAEVPMTFGSHRSKMVERIMKDPCKGKLSREEFIKIITWIDANAPYYGTHGGKKPIDFKDQPDFRPVPLAGKVDD